jgi:hypothetical protein
LIVSELRLAEELRRHRHCIMLSAKVAALIMTKLEKILLLSPGAP